MKFNKDLASLHAYLSGDGYVVKNPKSQKHKYYRIALRNTNKVLLKDFQNKFFRFFGIKPKICKDGRCRKESKAIYEYLTKEYSYYSYEWKMPFFKNKQLLSSWIRSFYDCEGWVENEERKNRSIKIESVNKPGLIQLKKSLLKFNIKTSTIKTKKHGDIFRLEIFAKDNLRKFKKYIGFTHPEKSRKLDEAIQSYVDYYWKIPKNKKKLINFIKEKGKLRKDRNCIRFCSIIKTNLLELKRILRKYKIKSKIYGPWTNNYKSKYYCLEIKQISKL